MQRTNSNGSSGAADASGVPGNRHELVDRHALGLRRQRRERVQQADAIGARLAHADDAAAADLDAGRAHALERLEPIAHRCAC